MDDIKIYNRAFISTCIAISVPLIADAWEKNNFIVIGNPPFGLRGQLALKFINHSSKFADYVCFILPQLFQSDGKGVPRKRVIGLNLIHSETLKTSFDRVI